MSNAKLVSKRQTIKETPEEIVQRLAWADALKKTNSDRTDAFLNVMMIAIGVGILFFFIPAYTKHEFTVWICDWGLTISGSVAALSVAGIMFTYDHRVFAEDQLTLMRTFVNAVKLDTYVGVDTVLEWDPRDFKKGGKVESTSGPNNKSYRHEWLSISGVLANGHQYRISITQKARVKKKWKRRGTVSREQVRSTLRLQLKLGKNEPITANAVVAHLDQDVPGRYLSNVTTKTKPRVLDVKWTKRNIAKYINHAGSYPIGIKPNEPSAILMWVYQAIAKAKTANKGTHTSQNTEEVS